MAACLNPILTSRRFRYYTSFTHFRRNVGTRTDFVGLDVSTFAGNPYNLTFRFSVRFEEVESVRNGIQGRSGSPGGPTITQLSLNVSPRKAIKFDGPVYWPLGLDFDEQSVIPEVESILQGVVFPWLDKYSSLPPARKSLADEDGFITVFRPWEVVLAIDVVLRDSQAAAQYLETLSERMSRWVPDLRAEIITCHMRYREAYPEVVPEFTFAEGV